MGRSDPAGSDGGDGYMLQLDGLRAFAVGFSALASFLQTKPCSL